jgi:hypothetical protein
MEDAELYLETCGVPHGLAELSQRLESTDIHRSTSQFYKAAYEFSVPLQGLGGGQESTRRPRDTPIDLVGYGNISGLVQSGRVR